MKKDSSFLKQISKYCIQIFLSVSLFLIGNGCINSHGGSEVSEVKNNSQAIKEKLSQSDYNPRYWLEGLSKKKHREVQMSEATATSIIDDAWSKGWRGVLY